MRELDAAWRFEVALMDRCSTRLEPFEWGTALFRDDMPRVYDQNFLRLERGFDEVSARELATEADRLQRPAGLAHRKVIVPDEEAGERLAPGFKELGWKRARHVLMAYRGSGPGTPRQPVRVLAPAELREAHIWVNAPDLGDVAAEQVVDSLQLIASVVERSSGFGVKVAGRVVSWCLLYEEGGIGQVEDVTTAPEHRRQGFGNAVVEAATRASLDSGNWLTFLVADDGDWPKDMYARLGYEPIGWRYEFTRT